MNISAPFIHRPIATALLMVGLLLGGLVTYRLLPVAALSMSRVRSNWTVICVKPSALAEVICVTPGICENCCSSGVASDDAMVCGSAPGSWAVTCIVGKFTFGSAATGSNR